VPLAAIQGSVPYAFVGGPFGSNLTARDYVDEGVPVVRGNNLPSESSFHDDDFVFVSEEKADELRSNTALPGDLVFTQRGTVGQVGLIPTGSRYPRYIISQSQMKLTVDERQADARFVYQFFRLPTTVARIIKLATGAGVPHINLATLKGFEITLPRLELQTRIADVLGHYDDLIENNRRRMALLEEAARQLYREWFVRLRFPGHEHTRIVNGVPEGWERRSLIDCVTFQSGGTPSKQRGDFWDGDIPWVSSGELTEMRLYDTPLHISREGAEAGSRLVPSGTILIVVRGMSLAKEFRLGVTTREMAFNQDLKALECRSGIDSAFIFSTLVAAREHIRDLATEAAHGTKKLETAVLESLPVLLPPAALRRTFRPVVDPIDAQRDNLHQQNRNLRIARDLLLPRLMSGEIAV